MRLSALARRIRRLEAERAAPDEIRLKGRGMAGLLRALDALDGSGAAAMAAPPLGSQARLLAAVADATAADAEPRS